MRYAAAHDRDDVGEIAVFTVLKMEQGGIFDQLAGGFRQVAQETVGWLTREMRDAAGGFYAALDADSEHEEGKFYVWTPEEVRALLTADEFAFLSPHYGLDFPPNFEGKHWHFIIAKPLDDVAVSIGISIESTQQVLAHARQKLSAARSKRVRPGRDDEDAEHGGFYFTSHDHETLLHRPKPGPDQATPSGNGIAAFALQRLEHILGEARYLDAAERVLTSFYPSIAGQAAGYTTLFMALKENLSQPDTVVVRGPAAELDVWRAATAAQYWPNTLAFFVPNGALDLPPALAKPETPTVNAWVCRGVNCLPAVTTPEALIALCNGAEDV